MLLYSIKIVECSQKQKRRCGFCGVKMTAWIWKKSYGHNATTWVWVFVAYIYKKTNHYMRHGIFVKPALFYCMIITLYLLQRAIFKNFFGIWSIAIAKVFIRIFHWTYTRNWDNVLPTTNLISYGNSYLVEKEKEKKAERKSRGIALWNCFFGGDDGATPSFPGDFGRRSWREGSYRKQSKCSLFHCLSHISSYRRKLKISNINWITIIKWHDMTNPQFHYKVTRQ